MRIIDAHNHPDWHGKDLKRFLQDMDEKNIEKCWLLSWECPRSEYYDGTVKVVPADMLGTTTGPIPFARCVSYAERAPERFILGYAPDPRDRDACCKLIAAHDIYNAKICGELKCRVMYDNFDCLRLFRTAGKLKMPVVMHFDYDHQTDVNDPRTDWYGGTIDTLERVLQACPETVFIGHAPGFWIHISDDDLYLQRSYPPENAPVTAPGRIAQLLRKYPNLYCDISANSGLKALSRDTGYAVEFLTEFQDRVLYARDNFSNLHQEFLNTLGLPESILSKIYSENAESLIEI